MLMKHLSFSLRYVSATSDSSKEGVWKMAMASDNPRNGASVHPLGQEA